MNKLTPPNTPQSFQTPLEKSVNVFISPFQEYINKQATASLFLFLCTIAALIWASYDAISASYLAFINTSIGLHIGNIAFTKPLWFWVNDILLTLFFFFVGLEIKREFLVGDLKKPKMASFVLISAIGGMLIPACFYLALNYGTPSAAAWGIPVPTDTAFALGLLYCFKKKLPKGIFTLIAALAIVDDIFSILIIAVFYTTKFNPLFLLFSLLLIGCLLIVNYAGFRKPIIYIFLGLLLWMSIELAGIHGTLSGIIIAFIIPARPQKTPKQFLKKIRGLLGYFEERKLKTSLVLEDKTQHELLERVEKTVQEATTPLQRWESNLELPIALLVLPAFALCNAGIPLNIDLLTQVFFHRISLGILFGLVIGKPLGIILFSRAAILLKLGELPEDTSFLQLSCVSFLTGIGFTMSLFIANLSFSSDKATLLLSKAAIIMSSLLASLLGIILLSLLKTTSSTNT